MPRIRVPADTQTAVLLRSRRRCCICYGLNRDTNMKAGQIAHLDKDSSNASEENLAFLCFRHHDEYDSRTSQRKGLTAGEVKHFRDELHDAIGKAFSVMVHFGTVTVPPEDPYAGRWIRVAPGNDGAEILLTPVPDDEEGSPRYAVTGTALRNESSEFGPNLGSVLFIDSVIDDRLEHTEAIGNCSYNLRLDFLRETELLMVKEWDTDAFGNNVTFVGEYRRA